MIAIPRIGHEVIVDFLEGDPDQPIIVGSVYNDNNKPPWELPANMTQSGLRTRSSPDGYQSTFNELRFEDKFDREEVFLHAERDMKRVVKNNDELEVGAEPKSGGEGNQKITILNDRTVTLNEGNDTLTIESGDHEIQVESGEQKVYVARKIDIEAGEEFRVTVGQSELTMDASGTIDIKGINITIDGVNVTLKAQAAFKAEGQAQAEVKGAMTTVEGSGILDLKAGGMAKLKGSITMIG